VQKRHTPTTLGRGAEPAGNPAARRMLGIGAFACAGGPPSFRSKSFVGCFASETKHTLTPTLVSLDSRLATIPIPFSTAPADAYALKLLVALEQRDRVAVNLGPGLVL
jgi:hypothetical protein